ncbi:M16 family metallopeptidase [Pseudogemmobacter sonorensis]|uniref:M16 family metallopeptidase n=1 Tax=Pseudogemmobacter sonorensis TaxID=2989681 RepID=UPI0036C620FA
MRLPGILHGLLPATPTLTRALTWGLAGALLLLLATLPLRAEEVSGFTLDNGLEVVVIEDHRASVVVQMVWYRAGAADEPHGKSGIAHFLEHLMFKGTDTIGLDQFSAIVEANGGDDNAFTSWDYTAYYQRIASDRLELVMEMEADRMQNLRITEEIVVTERQVILEERNQRTDSDPGALLNEQMRAALFLNHRYGQPIIGWRHEIERLGLEDALDWYRRHYAPNNAILVIAGDVTPDQVRALAEKHYGPIPASGAVPPRDRPQEPPHLAERRITFTDERVSTPYVYRSYLAPSRRPGDQKTAAAVGILAELLGGSGQTSYLARALQFDTQVAVHTAAFHSGTMLDSGTFGLYIVPAPGVGLAEAEAALDATVARFLEEGVDPAAFERVKTRFRAAEIYSRDNVQGLANMYGEERALGLSLEDIQGYGAIVDALTPEDVMAVAELVLNRNAAVTGWLDLPGEGDE